MTVNCLYGTIQTSQSSILTLVLTIDWRFKSHDKIFSLICLGMGDNNPGSKAAKNGRLVVVAYRMSTNKSAMRIKVIRRYPTKSPVFAVAKLDERRLIYSWGSSLSMITFEPRNEHQGHRYITQLTPQPKLGSRHPFGLRAL